MSSVNLIHVCQTASETSCITHKTAGRTSLQGGLENKTRQCVTCGLRLRVGSSPVEKQRCIYVKCKNAGARLPGFSFQIDMLASSLKLNVFLSASVSSFAK